MYKKSIMMKRRQKNVVFILSVLTFTLFFATGCCQPGEKSCSSSPTGCCPEDYECVGGECGCCPASQKCEDGFCTPQMDEECLNCHFCGYGCRCIPVEGGNGANWLVQDVPCSLQDGSRGIKTALREICGIFDVCDAEECTCDGEKCPYLGYYYAGDLPNGAPLCCEEGEIQNPNDPYSCCKEPCCCDPEVEHCEGGCCCTKDDPSTSENEGETCRNVETGLCCKEDVASCGDSHCCEKDYEVCLNPDTGECCSPSGICGTVCCPAGQHCVDEENSLCCGWTLEMCPSREQCCDTELDIGIPGSGEEICAGECGCCKIGEECINGACKKVCESDEQKCFINDEVVDCCKVGEECFPNCGGCCEMGETCTYNSNGDGGSWSCEDVETERCLDSEMAPGTTKTWKNANGDCDGCFGCSPFEGESACVCGDCTSICATASKPCCSPWSPVEPHCRGGFCEGK
ncbi:hypothetical protein ACFLZX_02250 [Nanoarchaeota archaeon]